MKEINKNKRKDNTARPIVFKNKLKYQHFYDRLGLYNNFEYIEFIKLEYYSGRYGDLASFLKFNFG